MDDLFALPDEQLFADFVIVKAQVSVASLLSHYGLVPKASGENYKLSCPFHEGTSPDNFSMHKKTGHFQCFSPACKVKGNVLDFVAKLENRSVSQAAVFLAKLQGIPALKRKDAHTISLQTSSKQMLPSPNRAQVVREPMSTGSQEKEINPPLKFALKYLDHTHSYGFERALTAETIQIFGCGFCSSKSMFAGRYLIPLHNAQGQLIGYAGRKVKDDTPGEKWLLPPSERGFYKTKLLFNFHRVLGQYANDTPIWLVENPFAAMIGFQLGYPTLSLLGAHLSEWQAETLAQHYRYINLLFDGDEAGRVGSEKAALLLSSSVYVRREILDENQQPDSLPLVDFEQRLKRP